VTARIRQLETQGRRHWHRAVTLVELTVVIAILGILISVSTLAFNNARDNSLQALTRNAIVTYAKIARNYAITNDIETMFVINPYDGRFELWHLNPPANGGAWDPFSSGQTPPQTDGYAFAPVFDSGASLPTDANGKPLAFVFPFDYQDRDPAGNFYRPRGGTVQDLDNFIWTALCFDENGKLVTRTRRIATRTQLRLNGSVNPNPPNRTRILERDFAPDLSLLENNFPLVTGFDSLITSTRGIIISDREAMQSVIGNSFTPVQLTQDWLDRTLAGGQFDEFAQLIVFDRQSGEPLIPEDER